MREMDAVFRALSDPARRRLLDRLNERNGLSLTELCADMGMTRQSVSKHLDVLEEAGLVTTLRRGREKLHFLNAVLPISDIADRWIHHDHRARAEALSDLKTALEATPMDQKSNQTTFVYTTYINATPEQVWQGLTEPAFTEALLAAPGDRRGLVPHGLAEGLPRTTWPTTRSGSWSGTPSRSSSSPTPIGGSLIPGIRSPRNGPPHTASTKSRSPPGGPSPVPRLPSRY